MRVFTCLSQNVSMLIDRDKKRSSSSSSRRLHLNFKSKKRRPLTPLPAVPGKLGSSTGRPDTVVTPRSSSLSRRPGKDQAPNDENIPPLPALPAASLSVNQSTTTARTIEGKPLTRINIPLPPIPDQRDASIYIKELDDHGDGDSDYLPLSHVEPPLTEENDSGNGSRGSRIGVSSTTTSTATIHSDELDARIKSVRSLNEAFIQSTASLQARQALSGDTKPELPCSHLDSHQVDGTYSRQRHLGNRDWKRRAGRVFPSPSPESTSCRYDVKNNNNNNDENNDGDKKAEIPWETPRKSSYDHRFVNAARSRLVRPVAKRRNVQFELQQGDSLHRFESPQIDVTALTLPEEGDSNGGQSPVYSQIELSSQDSSSLWASTLDDFTCDSQGLYENADRLGRPRCEGRSQASVEDDPRGVTVCDSVAYDDSQVSDYSQVDFTPSPTCAQSQLGEEDARFLETAGVPVATRPGNGHGASSKKNKEEDDGMGRVSYECPVTSRLPSPSRKTYVNVKADTGVKATDSYDYPYESSNCRASEFLGCMSFGVPHLLQKDLNGWYYLLTEEVGKRKHLKAHFKNNPGLSARGLSGSVPFLNSAVEGQERIAITVPRGKNGFGFSFVGELPPKVGRVDKASPAEQAGLKKGDSVIIINGQNISRSNCESVAHLIKKKSPQFLTLELLRDHMVSLDKAEANSSSSSTNTKRGVGTSTDHVYESILEGSPVSAELLKENQRWAQSSGRHRRRNDEFLTDDEQIISHGGLGRRGNLAAVTSTPMPTMASAVPPSSAQMMKRHESVHRLMSLELDYIDFMRFGSERYSRPLRHCIISASQHSVMFQNVEKLVTISEYHIKQLQDSNSSVNSDTDDSQSSETNIFPNSVALIYQSKIHMLCQAYDTYAHGLTHSNALLKELRRNRDFIKFIHEPPAPEFAQSMPQPSISAYINRPVQYIHELYSVFRDLFSITPRASPDYAVLQLVVCKLAQCVSAITNLSSDGRVHSLDSLTSSQGCSTSQTTSSGKGSMASLTSYSSAEAEALCPTVPTASTSTRSVDSEVARIQDLLVFPPDVPTFQLCQEDRHIIFQGDIFRYQQGSWFKSHLLLLSDLILLLDQEAGVKLRVVEAPIYLSDLAGIEINRKHASEFVLHLHSTPIYTTSLAARSNNGDPSGMASTKALLLRAPSSQDKFVWKSLVEQRVSSVSGNKLQHYGSMRDISNIKTSAVL